MKFSKVNAWLMALSFTATTVCTNGLTVQAESSLPEVESNIQDETVIVGNSAGNIAGKVIGQEHSTEIVHVVGKMLNRFIK